ncbi:lysophospholipase [Algoriphagus sp. AGSA1]|uniref:alpha/beta hydrolase n=1 Tax=Algoriphagus sp. AGSA1 TaxID=2907213 RepID=UPI001F1589EC|nr:alpha/beta hydrolase [Algoriphagus sp. AGSA1]MCE7057538.1 lysophospholipase [Algoriphagus sp. AGSA1]
MKLKIITLALVMLAGNLLAQISDKEITLETKTGNIEGALLSPDVSKKIPVVLIIAGSGPTDRNGNNPMMTNNHLKMLAEGLLGNGIASVRYDKRGVAESKDSGLKEIDLRFENYVDDAVSWVEFLRKDKRFSEIIILGHSEGSLIGMLAAGKSQADRFISIAGAGIPAGEAIKEQFKSQPPVVLEQALPIIEQLEKGETAEEVPQMLYSIFRPSIQPYIISWFKYDPQKEIAKLDIPTLIIQGTTDIQIGVSDADKLGNANEEAKKQIIEGMNHILKDSELDRSKNIATYSMPDLPLNVELMDIIIQFIDK